MCYGSQRERLCPITGAFAFAGAASSEIVTQTLLVHP